MTTVYPKVFALSIPERVKQSSKQHINSKAKIATEQKASLNGLPYAIIAFGKQRDGDEKIALIGVLHGDDPASVLDEFKSKARERMAKLN